MRDITNVVATWLVTYAMHSTILLAALLSMRFIRTAAAREFVLKDSAPQQQ